MRTIVFLFLAFLVGFASATLHPAYEDLQTESEERCGWCLQHIEPAIKKAVLSSQPYDNTRISIENALQAILEATESDDEAEMIREEVEMMRWDTGRMRQISALQVFYHLHPTLRHYLDRLADHVVCACKLLEVGEHERMMHRVLEYHAQSVMREYRAHGYPEGMEPPARLRGRRKPVADGEL